MTTATSRATFGTVLAAIQGTALAATSLVSTVTNAVDMGNRAVDDMARRQKIRSETDELVYEDSYLNEKTRELTEQQDQIQAWCDAKTGREKKFQDNLNSLKLRLAQRRGEPTPT